jgi:hypothetical protein
MDVWYGEQGSFFAEEFAMKKVILDAEMRAKLGGLANELTLADETGAALAYLLPADVYNRMRDAWDDREPTREERDAAREEYRSRGGLSTAAAIEFVRAGKFQNEGQA